MHLNVFDIRGISQFYTWHVDSMSCDYHHDLKQDDIGRLRIFVERNISCEAQWLYCFELIVQNDVFGLAVYRSMRIMEGDRSKADFEIIGTDEELAIAIFIEKIMSETTISEQMSWDHAAPDIVKKHAAHKDVLRTKLHKICTEFLKEN
jgi:hypothetical protein